MQTTNDFYEDKISAVLAALGIPLALIAEKRLPPYAVAEELVVAEVDAGGREYLLTPEASRAWAAMKQAASQDRVVIEIVSAFRDLERQSAIIRAKLERGMAIDKILTLSAPPGYSEHHTGRAVDINTPGCIATEEMFEDTEAFRWLSVHAGRFGFALSYPRGNATGFIYEPWHWCFQQRIG
jgi:D-alanyl-D-alanine carboxypeptidase